MARRSPSVEAGLAPARSSLSMARRAVSVEGWTSAVLWAADAARDAVDTMMQLQGIHCIAPDLADRLRELGPELPAHSELRRGAESLDRLCGFIRIATNPDVLHLLIGPHEARTAVSTAERLLAAGDAMATGEEG